MVKRPAVNRNDAGSSPACSAENQFFNPSVQCLTEPARKSSKLEVRVQLPLPTQQFCGAMVSTLGFEPKDVGSNPAGTAKYGKVAQQVEQAVEAR